MQLIVNQKLVRNRVRLAGLLHVGALAVFGVGFFVSLAPESWLYAYVAIFVGIFLYQIAQMNLRRWGPRHRLDELLARSLKGLDNRYTLVAFASPNLPDYLLVGPSGVQVLIPRTHSGTVTCRNDRWSLENGRGRLLRLFRQPLGNPSADARLAIESVKRHLADKDGASTAPVEAIIVFTSPEVRLRNEGCTYTLTTLKELRHYLRRLKGSLSPHEVARLRDLLARFAAEGGRA